MSLGNADDTAIKDDKKKEKPLPEETTQAMLDAMEVKRRVVEMCLKRKNLKLFSRSGHFLAKVARPKPPVVTPRYTFQVDRFIEVQREINRDRITADQAKFLAEAFADQKALITTESEALMKEIVKLYKDDGQARMEYGYYISLVSTFREMWTFICFASNQVYRQSEHKFLPTVLIKHFTEFFETIKEYNVNQITDIAHLQEIVKLRNDVVNCLRDFFRVVEPMLTGTDGRHFDDLEERFCPFDLEYICGSIGAGRNRVPLMKMLMSMRKCDLELSEVRLKLVQEVTDLQTNNRKWLKLIVPNETKSFDTLEQVIMQNEYRTQETFYDELTMMDRLRQTMSKNMHQEFIADLMRLTLVGQSLRKAKVMTYQKLQEAGDNELGEIHSMLEGISAIEAHILIIHRIYAPFVDDKRGFYHCTVPNDVVFFAEKLCKNILSTKCAKPSKVIKEEVKLLREKMVRTIRGFYMMEEEHAKRDYVQYVHPRRGDYVQPGRHFPTRQDKFKKEVEAALTMYRNEQKRLFAEIEKNKMARVEWPTKPNTPKYVFGESPLGITAFASNFDSVMTYAHIQRCQVAGDVKYNDPENVLGERILEYAYRCFTKWGIFPIEKKLSKYIYDRIVHVYGNDKVRIGRKTLKYIADDFVDVIKYHVLTIDRKISVEFKPMRKWMAKKMAKHVINEFQKHALKFHGAVPKFQPDETSDVSDTDDSSSEEEYSDEEEEETKEDAKAAC